MNIKSRLRAVRKYHVSILATNLLAIVLSIFFIRAYRLKGFPILPSLVFLSIILLVFLSVCILILKPYGKIKNIFPNAKLIVINIIIAAIVSLLFLGQIGLLGVIFTIVFASLLFEVEHIIYEGMKI